MKVDYLTIPEITVSYKDTVKTSERAKITCANDAVTILNTAFENCMEHHEEVNVLYLNNASRVLGISNVSKGGISKALIDVRIILQTALKVSASAILLSHNHPSGCCKPSSEDVAMTEMVKKGCEAIGIRLFDHLIVSNEFYTSFAEEGIL